MWMSIHYTINLVSVLGISSSDIHRFLRSIRKGDQSFILFSGSFLPKGRRRYEIKLFIQETISPVNGSGFQLLKRQSPESNKTPPSPLLRLIQSVITPGSDVPWWLTRAGSMSVEASVRTRRSSAAWSPTTRTLTR